jgi:hypothetical protein
VIPRLGDEGQGGWLSHMRGDNHAIPIWATTVSEFTHPCMQVHRDEMSDGQGCNHLPRPIITPACHSVSHVYSTRSRISRKTRHQCGPRSTRIPASIVNNLRECSSDSLNGSRSSRRCSVRVIFGRMVRGALRSVVSAVVVVSAAAAAAAAAVDFDVVV